MPNQYGKTQYAVKWPGHSYLVYADDPQDALVQVGAPEDAEVSESFLDKNDLMRLLVGLGRG